MITNYLLKLSPLPLLSSLLLPPPLKLLQISLPWYRKVWKLAWKVLSMVCMFKLDSILFQFSSIISNYIFKTCVILNPSLQTPFIPGPTPKFCNLPLPPYISWCNMPTYTLHLKHYLDTNSRWLKWNKRVGVKLNGLLTGKEGGWERRGWGGRETAGSRGRRRKEVEEGRGECKATGSERWGKWELKWRRKGAWGRGRWGWR